MWEGQKDRSVRERIQEWERERERNTGVGEREGV